MSHAFNADKFLEEVYLGLGKRTSGPISPDLPYYDNDLPLIPYDLDKAAQLLDEAGWIDTDGNGVRDKMINGTKVDFDFGQESETSFVSVFGKCSSLRNVEYAWMRPASTYSICLWLITPPRSCFRSVCCEKTAWPMISNFGSDPLLFHAVCSEREDAFAFWQRSVTFSNAV